MQRIPIGFLLLVALPVITQHAAAQPDTDLHNLSSSGSTLDLAIANDNQVPAGTFESGTHTLYLEARRATWRPHLDADSAMIVLAFAEAGRAPSIPGPLLRVPQGTEVRITVRNAVPPGFMIGLPTPRHQRPDLSSLAGPTLVVHGLRAGTVADDTLHVAARATREVWFHADTPGTYFYWGALSEASIAERTGRDSQLTGAIVVDPVGVDAPDDRVFVITMIDAFPDSTQSPSWEGAFGPAINGLAWPHTERLSYAVGDTVHWRWVNGSGFDHPMHLHGFHFRTLARGDGASDTPFPEDAVPTVVTELMEPGDTFRMEWTPTRSGNWLMHCHFVTHIIPAVPRDEATRVHDLHDVAHHAMTAMDGLVVGISVSDTARAAVLPDPHQRLRLIAQERPVPGEDAVVRGFVLQGADDRPEPDSVVVPGPPLVLTRGERTEITVVNQLSEPTTIHWHGMELESVFDGVAGWSRTGTRIAPLVAPGDSFVVSITPPRAGTFIYHTHMDETEQLETGMYGPLLVLEPGEAFDPEVDRVLVVGGSVEGWATLNGQAAPEPITLDAGTTYRLRVINIHKEATVDVTLTVDGEPVRWRALAKDGANLPPTLRRAQRAEVRMGVGETYDFLWTPGAPGEAMLRVHVPFPTWPGSLDVNQPILMR